MNFKMEAAMEKNREEFRSFTLRDCVVEQKSGADFELCHRHLLLLVFSHLAI